jgi:hypothetical protein
MNRVVTYQELIDVLAMKPNPLDEEGVAGLSIEWVPDQGRGPLFLSGQSFLFFFLALTHTPAQGLITRRVSRCAPGPRWEDTLPCQPSFVRSQIVKLEHAGLWNQAHYNLPPPEHPIMRHGHTYFVRIKDAETGRDRMVCLDTPEDAPERSVQRLGRAITSLTNRTRWGFVWRSRLHALLRTFRWA